MYKLTLTEIIDIIVIILIVIRLLSELFALFKQGKLIVKGEGGKGYTIFYAWILFLFVLLLYGTVRNYMDYKKYKFYTDFYTDRNVNQILMGIFWIEFTFLNLIRYLRGSEIREKGIYKFGLFYKWHRIRCYYWTSSTTIKFEIDSLFKFKRNLDITIKDESKLKADETLQRYIAHKV